MCAKNPRQKIRRHKSPYEQKSLRQRSPCEQRAQGKKLEDIKNTYTLEYKAGKSLTSEDSKASKILLCQSLKTKSRAKKFVAPCKSSKGGWRFAKLKRSTAASTTFILSPVQKGGGASQSVSLHSRRTKRGKINMFIAYTKLWFALQEKLHFAIRAKKM